VVSAEVKSSTRGALCFRASEQDRRGTNPDLQFTLGGDSDRYSRCAIPLGKLNIALSVALVLMSLVQFAYLPLVSETGLLDWRLID
jgi:hypothetical protein